MLVMLAQGRGIAADIRLAPGQAADVFGGVPQRLSAQFQNESTNEIASAPVRYRLYQASSSTVVPVSSATEWRTISVGHGQVVTEVFAYNFPAVRAESTFHLVWFDGERKLGTTRVRVFPENLLSSISNTPQSGIVDPSGYFSNTLASVGLQQLRDADEIGVFEGKLILVAPIYEADRVNGLTEALKRRAASGVGVVWLQSAPSSDRASVLPAYVVGHGEGRFVIAQEVLVNNLASSPLAQLRLLELIDLALGRKKLGLPEEPHASLSSRD